jgi:hypothetical protein
VASLVATSPAAAAPPAAGAAEPALAAEKKACSDAYDRTQSLRLGGQLQAAREQAALCTRDACAEFIRADCTTWLVQIDAGMPTVVFEVRDARGNDTTQVSVALDGKPWLTAVDVTARPIDPGTHTLRFTIPGMPPIERSVVVREGEKNKKVSVAFGTAPPPVAPLTAPPPAPVVPPEEDDTPVAPWVIGGVGLAALATGGVLAAVVASEKSTFDEHCDDATRTCDAEGIAAGETGRTLGPLSTVSLVLGALGVGVATVWLIGDAAEDDASPSTAVGTGPVLGPAGAGWGLRGRFQ